MLDRSLVLLAAVLTGAGWWSSPAVAQVQPAAPAASAEVVFPCQVFATEKVALASPVPGVLAAVLVDRGDRVVKDQVVAQLHAEVEQTQVALAEAKASADAQLQSKKAHLAFAERTLARNLGLVDQHFVSEHDIDQLRTDRDIAAQDVAAQIESITLAKRELEEARAQLALRTIRSPIDGVVTNRRLMAGEQTRDQAILDIARVDRLNVEVALPTSYIGRVTVGSTGSLSFDAPGLERRSAKVSLVDPVVDEMSNTFGVRFVLDNKDGKIPAGVKCRVGFGELP